MNTESYVYFSLFGSNADPKIITDLLGITPTSTWKNGDEGPPRRYTYSKWALRSTSQEYLDMNKLVDEAINPLFDKIEIINLIKSKYQFQSILQIVLYIDTNEDVSTPFIGHNKRTIEFLYKTQTTTDTDIYLFNSEKKAGNEI